MNLQRREFLAAGAAIGAIQPLVFAQDGNDAAIAALLCERLHHEGIGLAAAVVDGERVRIAGAGRRGLSADTAPDDNTLFELGSITKTFTALLLADMVVRRELALDDAVEAVLPDGLKLRDSAGAPITWADIATHRSGLPRLPSNLRDPNGADPYDYSRKNLFAFLASWNPDCARRRSERL